MVSGDVQIGGSNVVSLLLASSKNLPIRAIAGGTTAQPSGEKDFGALLAAKGKGVSDPKDLEGKTVAVNTLTSSRSGTATEGFVYALSAEHVRRRLAELRPGASSAYVGWKDEHRCHGAMQQLASEYGTNMPASGAKDDIPGMEMEHHDHTG